MLIRSRVGASLFRDIVHTEQQSLCQQHQFNDINGLELH